MTKHLPKIRDEIDATPTEHNDQHYFILYDRTGISPYKLVATPLVLLVISYLDGETSILDIYEKIRKEPFIEKISCSDIDKVVEELNNSYFLEGNSFDDFNAQIKRSFLSNPTREPTSAGSAYPDDCKKLKYYLDTILAEDIPVEELEVFKNNYYPRGIIIPHIDYLRGAPGYSQAYNLLKKRQPPKTVIILGTAHFPLNNSIVLCEKNFKTPLGLSLYNKKLGDKIKVATGYYSQSDEDIFVHKVEHSIELQIVWLQHVWGDSVKIVPILVNSLHNYIDYGQDLANLENDQILQQLSNVLEEAVESENTMLLASADLAHIGPRFGDDREISNQYLSEVEIFDREYLAAVASGEPLSSLAYLQQHQDKYNICGSACIFYLNYTLKDLGGRLLGYHQATTPEMQQAVTYASMVFE